MARFVIDAPTLVHVITHDLKIHPSCQLVAPSPIRSDALQLLLDRVRRDALDPSSVRSLHERMTEIRIRVLGDRVSRWSAWRLAVEQGWSDLRAAEYVALVRLQADALVTVDVALGAQAGPLVRVEPVAALVSPPDEARGSDT